MRHSAQQQQQQQQQRADLASVVAGGRAVMSSSLERDMSSRKQSYCERRRANRRRGATKSPASVQLVAIVHRERAAELRAEAENRLARDAHESNRSARDRSGKKLAAVGRFGRRLFAGRRAARAESSAEPGERRRRGEQSDGAKTASGRLIDGIDSADRGEREKETQRSKRASACDLIGLRESARRRAEDDGDRQKAEQVIEFKFDLIVDDLDAQERRRERAPPPPTSMMTDAERKLVDRLDALIESFVAHSQDVCLMNVGRQTHPIELAERAPASRLLRPTGAGYTCSLLEYSLARALELARPSAEHRDERRVDVSVDLISRASDAGAELLSCENLLAEGDATDAPLECASLGEALGILDRVKVKMDERRDRRSLLVVGLKLTREINGGLFSNRMALIDLDPELRELQPIFESVFDGQALAYLKRQKLRLQALESSSLLSPSSPGSSSQDDEGRRSAERANGHGKHLHQVASANRLSQAEWLVYKQLSSASIRALALVNVHKLDDCARDGHLLDAALEHQLMERNLLLLEFARSLQRAAGSRMRRRRRHLRSNHHLASSNISVSIESESSSSTSATTSSASKRLASSAVWCSPVRSLRARASSPPATLRRLADRQLSLSQRRHRGHHQRDSSLSPSSRALHRHSSARTHQRRTSVSIYNSMSPMHRQAQVMSSASQLYASNEETTRRRRLANWLTMDEPLISATNHYYGHNNRHRRQSEFTESSSMSTSSGSQSHRHRRRDSSEATETRQLERPSNWPNGPTVAALTGDQFSSYDDSDSITSAILNSHSSSSYGRILQHMQRKRSSSMAPPASATSHLMSEGDEHIEMRWVPSVINTQQQQQQWEAPVGSPLRRTVTPKGGYRQHQQLIQIDCPPGGQTTHQGVEYERQSVSLVDDPSAGLVDTSHADNVSDICSIVVAEPPKQLKLEEFLTQLSSVIAPKSNGDTESVAQESAQEHRGLTLSSRAGGGGGDDDEDDCKSHSSILEHLSSLAHESNSKFNCRRDVDTTRLTEEQRASDQLTPALGHLQRLLNSSDRCARKSGGSQDSGSIEDRLKALTIDCRPALMTAAMATSSQLLSAQTSSPISTPTSAFISSNESNCSSTESSSSNSAAVGTSSELNSDMSNVKGKQQPSTIPNISNRYASVNRNHLNVRT